ncbi:MAG TPA: hypothetical protein VGQ83_08245 [Polyangia bacterium]|jgi:hypothetical protein
MRTLLAAALMLAVGHPLTGCSTSTAPGAADAAAADAAADAAAVADAAPDAAVDRGAPDLPPTPATCGNGRLDPQEGCDGTLFPAGLSTCDDNWLGAGTTTCTDRCTLDVSGCESQDYCAGNGFYNDDECDACELMHGHPDPACAAHCGADGFCASWYDPAVGVWSCEAAGFGPDPDCGSCGNGVAEGHEKCDGADFAWFQGVHLSTCEVWGYAGGTLGCLPTCLPDFSGCH